MRNSKRKICGKKEHKKRLSIERRYDWGKKDVRRGEVEE